MAILEHQEVGILVHQGRVQLKLAGRTHYLHPRHARLLGWRIGEAAASAWSTDDAEPALAAEQILLHFPAPGRTIMRIRSGGGVFDFDLPFTQLKALASAAGAALEHGPPAGEA